MRGYAPGENNLTGYVKFFQEQVYAPLQVAFPSDFPLLQLNPDFRTPNDRGRLFVRELTHADAVQALFRLPLDHHGTGLVSVVAIVLTVAVLREYHRQSLKDKPLIVAIEEPEVHLHAHAQRTFLNYLKSLSQNHQTIVSTHSPLFVDRTDPLNVFVVRRKSLNDGEASKAETFWKAGTTRVFGCSYKNTWQEVRDILGIRLSDALMAGEFNLLVEGPTEEVLLQAMAQVWANQTGNRLDFDRVLIVGGEGGGNLPYLARLLIHTGNPTAVFVDGDRAGHNTVEQIKRERLAVEFLFQLDSSILQPPLNTLAECEFEDFLDPQHLLHVFNQAFSNVPGFDFLPLSFEEFQREQQQLMGMRKSFGWIATVESLLVLHTVVESKRKQHSPKVDKRKLAEAAAAFILDKALSLPEFCDDLFRRIQKSLRSYK